MNLFISAFNGMLPLAATIHHRASIQSTVQLEMRSQVGAHQYVFD